MFHRRKSDERSHKKCIKYKDLDELVLKNARLRFCAEQLHNLNFIFQKKLQRTAPPSGKYQIRIYDQLSGHWLHEKWINK